MLHAKGGGNRPPAKLGCDIGFTVTRISGGGDNENGLLKETCQDRLANLQTYKLVREVNW